MTIYNAYANGNTFVLDELDTMTYMTYAQLLDHLLTLTPQQLNQTVTIYSRSMDEYFAVSSVTEAGEDCDVLDPDQQVLNA